MPQQETTRVTVEEMASARESRAMAQMTLLSRHKGAVVVCLTMNIAGPIKRSDRFDRAFDAGERAVRAVLAPHKTHFAHAIREKTGCEAIFCVEGDATQIKRRLCALEDGSPIGRLWDIDVLYGMGEKVSRTDLGLPPRKCLICGEDAPVCARSRAHSVITLRDKTNEIIDGHFREEFALRVARQAQRALLSEVAISPKPGLVDRENTGAHSDMDVFTFLDSACALRDYFESCVRIGLSAHARYWAKRPEIDCDPDEKDEDICIPETSAESECFDALRVPGLLAEAAMKDATRGVNTHKGAIFSLGIFCAALGMTYSLYSSSGSELIKLAFITCRKMTQKQMQKEIGALRSREREAQTFGEMLCQSTAAGGVRGEASLGFPSVKNVGLPRFKQALDAGLSLNDAGLCALVALMTCVEDTNAVRRGNPEGARAMKRAAREIDREIAAALESGGMKAFGLVGRMRDWDAMLTLQNISPGGCADMLALTLLAAFMEESESRPPAKPVA